MESLKYYYLQKMKHQLSLMAQNTNHTLLSLLQQERQALDEEEGRLSFQPRQEKQSWMGKRLSAEQTTHSTGSIEERIVNGAFLHDYRQVEYPSWENIVTQDRQKNTLNKAYDHRDYLPVALQTASSCQEESMVRSL